MAKMNISAVRGMGPDLAKKLQAKGIKNTDALLSQASSESQRRQLARELGIEPSQLLEFVNRADLARIKGIGRQFANLLEEGGVDSCKELAQRRPDHLHQKLVEVSKSGGFTKRPPTFKEVQSWVEQAKAMAQK